MGSQLKKVPISTLIIMGGLLILALIPFASAQNTNSANPQIFPLNSKPYGLTYGDWTSHGFTSRINSSLVLFVN